jgi:predicted deacylase
MPPDEFHPENFPLVRGASAGATLVVSANVHVDEYEGVRAIHEVFDELNPERMAGNPIAAPVLNPPAFWSGTRTSPLDGANLARVFPGDPEGCPSQRLAWHFGKSSVALACLRRLGVYCEPAGAAASSPSPAVRADRVRPVLEEFIAQR